MEYALKLILVCPEKTHPMVDTTPYIQVQMESGKVVHVFEPNVNLDAFRSDYVSPNDD